jgi:hypothetical protein
MDDKKEAARLRAKIWALKNKEKVIAYRLANKEKAKIAKKKWVDKNREKVYTENSARQKIDKEGVRKRVGRYKNTENGKIVYRASRDAYRSRCKEASLNRYDMKKVYNIYKACKKLNAETGLENHVDHIVPIRHLLVCGLHVSWNLQVIPKQDNLSKNNHFEG